MLQFRLRRAAPPMGRLRLTGALGLMLGTFALTLAIGAHAQTPANQTPANQTPANQTPANQTPANQTPANQTSAAPTPAANASPGATPGVSPAAAPDPVVAKVNGQPIHLSELQAAVQELPVNARNLSPDTLYPMLLEQLIDGKALVIEARKAGLRTPRRCSTRSPPPPTACCNPRC